MFRICIIRGSESAKPCSLLCFTYKAQQSKSICSSNSKLSHIYLCCANGWRTIVFMMRGMKSATSWYTCCLYSWNISTTIMGNSVSTFRDSTARGITLYWKEQNTKFKPFSFIKIMKLNISCIPSLNYVEELIQVLNSNP